MPTYRLTLEYDGGAYSGWQRQPGRTTVEGVVRTAVRAVTGEDAVLTAAGRTDAGAHSHGQVAGVTLQRSWEPARLMAALNSALPGDVAVVAAGAAADGFHARFDAVARSYRYVVVPRHRRSPLTRSYAWYVRGDVDLDAMRRSAALLRGTHDFAAFGRAVRPGGTTRRTVNDVRIRVAAVHDGAEQTPLDAIIIDVSANAFLYGMMRTIAGALVAVGQGRLGADDIAGMLAQPHAPHPHVTVAPAHGLHQWTVTYA